MTTKAPAKVKPEDPEKPIKKIYNMVEELSDVIPIQNERNRLAFCINRVYEGLAGSIKEAVQSARPDSCTINFKDLEEIVSKKYKELNLQ
jgi:hypothetical protein